MGGRKLGIQLYRALQGGQRPVILAQKVARCTLNDNIHPVCGETIIRRKLTRWQHNVHTEYMQKERNVLKALQEALDKYFQMPFLG